MPKYHRLHIQLQPELYEYVDELARKNFTDIASIVRNYIRALRDERIERLSQVSIVDVSAYKMIEKFLDVLRTTREYEIRVDEEGV